MAKAGIKNTWTGYEPLYELKPFAQDVWIVDGGWIKFYGLPFPSRMTVVRLSDGNVWVHSPIALNKHIVQAVSAIGPVQYLVAPNWIHYAWVAEWQQQFPSAKTLVCPGVVARAASRGKQLRFDDELSNKPPVYWHADLDQRLVQSDRHSEIVFFHKLSRTLILTDLMENFEKHKMPWWTRPLLKIGGVCAPHGGMPRDMAASFKHHRQHLAGAVAQMIAWAPEKIVLAHGKCFEERGTQELKRAFHKFCF